jgi:hypothetical protein
MQTTEVTLDKQTAQEVIQKLLTNSRDDEFAFYTDSRADYELLFQAANANMFPELLTITHRGLRLKKRFVHSPLTMARA